MRRVEKMRKAVKRVTPAAVEMMTQAVMTIATVRVKTVSL